MNEQGQHSYPHNLYMFPVHPSASLGRVAFAAVYVFPAAASKVVIRQ